MQSITYRDGRKVLVRVVPEPGSTFDFGFYGTGVAVCGPDDHFDFSIGEAIAGGRAIIEFGQQVVQTAEAEVITEARFRELITASLEEQIAAMTAGAEAEAETSEETPAETPSREQVWAERSATEEEQQSFADAVDAKIAEDAPQVLEGVLEALPIRTFENKLDDWKHAYSEVFHELLPKIGAKKAALEAADAATAIALS